MSIKEVEDLEQKYEDLRNKILIWDSLIKKIPSRIIQDYLYKKKLFPLNDQYQKTFVILREITRQVYPERFSTSEGNA